eukprot:COSAG02_NODE_27471_length_609_cov_0.427451_1_plen_63_part_10
MTSTNSSGVEAALKVAKMADVVVLGLTVPFTRVLVVDRRKEATAKCSSNNTKQGGRLFAISVC